MFFVLFRLFLYISLWYVPPLLDSVELLYPEVISRFPHDPEAFTQGLAIEGEDLYESTGLYGESSLRCLDLLTKQLKIKKMLSPNVFGEGIAVFPGRLIQLTWKGERAFVYEQPSLKLIHHLTYQGEGWGLCRDQETVWMSDGTSLLVQRDSQTFQILKTLKVHLEGVPVSGLNDLECVEENLYANVWRTDCLLRINKKTGEVTGVIEASRLLSDKEKKALTFDAVLNGIAFQAASKTFFLTGKRWPWIFQVRFVTASINTEQAWQYITLKK